MKKNPLFILCSLIILGLSCSQTIVEFDISDKGLEILQAAAPSEEYVIYVSSQDVPKSIEELEDYSVVSCTGEEAANRAIQVKMGINTGINVPMDIRFAMGENSTNGIKNAIEGKGIEGKTIALAKRDVKAPSGAVELIFR